MQSMWNKIVTILSFTVLFTVIGVAVSAQEVLRGKITDKEGKPMQGVSVFLQIQPAYLHAQEHLLKP